MTDARRVGLVALAYWAVFGGLCLLLYPVTMTDSITRYAPMADAFARGDWELVFHPRFGVLFEVLCGCVCRLTGLPGAKAIQVVSTGFVALSGIPLFFVAKRLFGASVAWWSLALLFVSDDLTRYAMDGLRDPGKCLAFALMAYGAVTRRTGWLGLGLFLLVTLVSYGFAVGSATLFAWCLYALVSRPPAEADAGVRARLRLLPLPALGWAAAARCRTSSARSTCRTTSSTRSGRSSSRRAGGMR